MIFKEAFESLRLKFTSGNSIDVERATILRKEWDAILPALESYASLPEETINTIEKLEKGWEGEKGRAVKISIQPTYGATCWEVVLINVNKKPEKDGYLGENGNGVPSFACIIASETEFIISDKNPPNMFNVVDGDKFKGSGPGLEATINLAIDKAKELGV